MNQLLAGKLIARKRKEKNLTQEQLAERLGVSNKTVSKWETGRCMPDYAIVKDLCEELGITITELIDGGETEEKRIVVYEDENISDQIPKKESVILSVVGAVLIFCIVIGLISGVGKSNRSSDKKEKLQSNTNQNTENIVAENKEINIIYKGAVVYELSERDGKSRKHRYYDILLENDSQEIINNITVKLQFLDKNNNRIEAVGNDNPTALCRVFPGQTFSISGFVGEGIAEKMLVTGCEFYTETEAYYNIPFVEDEKFVPLTKDDKFIEGEISESPTNAVRGAITTKAKEDLSVESIQTEEVENGYVCVSAVVTNDFTTAISTLAITFIMLDEKGNITDVMYPQTGTTVQPGQSITIGVTVPASSGKYVTVDGYSYYWGEEQFQAGFFSEIPQAVKLD